MEIGTTQFFRTTLHEIDQLILRQSLVLQQKLNFHWRIIYELLISMIRDRLLALIDRLGLRIPAPLPAASSRRAVRVSLVLDPSYSRRIFTPSCRASQVLVWDCRAVSLRAI
jgi:hypothetical protein